MAGIVYLKTNRFEVKLEGITFKARDFESVCSMDFLFPEGKIWARPPVVGIDVMRHPRDPSIVLVLLCFGVGCVILRFNSGDVLTESIFKFLTDDRIRFVGFGIPEKKDLFPFQELGLTKNKVDIGYLAAKLLNDSKYERYELAELARKVLKIKNMIGLTEASSFERHEQIKCAICQLFITCAIAMALLGANDKKKSGDTHKKSSFLKNLNSLPLFTEGWFKFPKIKKENDKTHVEKCHDFPVQKKHVEGHFGKDNYVKSIVKEGFLKNGLIQAKGKDGDLGDNPIIFTYKDDPSWDDLFHFKGCGGTIDDSFNPIKCKESSNPYDNPSKYAVCEIKKPLKGILKCPSMRYESSQPSTSRPVSPPSGPEELKSFKGSLKRANSKGYNVSFK